MVDTLATRPVGRLMNPVVEMLPAGSPSTVPTETDRGSPPRDAPATWGRATDLTDRAIERLARRFMFNVEIGMMREDYQTGCVSKNVLDGQIWRLHRLFPRVPTWMIRSLVEQ